jgi:hypothetical protein
VDDAASDVSFIKLSHAALQLTIMPEWLDVDTLTYQSYMGLSRGGNAAAAVSANDILSVERATWRQRVCL